jgi:hypothetical protein
MGDPVLNKRCPTLAGSTYRTSPANAARFPPELPKFWAGERNFAIILSDVDDFSGVFSRRIFKLTVEHPIFVT